MRELNLLKMGRTRDLYLLDFGDLARKFRVARPIPTSLATYTYRKSASSCDLYLPAFRAEE